MAQNGITSSKSTCVGVWGPSRLDGERGSTSRKLASAICCARPFPVLPDPIDDREQARWHPERRWRQLAELQSAHRDLDDVIALIGETAHFDLIQVKRLKKRKLMLKDQIAQIESRLLPDIIA